jgi:hypothetical protein
MKARISLRTVAVCTGLALAAGAWAQDRAASTSDGLPYNDIQQTADGVRYLTGGIGVEAQERLNERAGDFNLKLVFALNEGNYIADVGVILRDGQGRTVIEEVADGPFFMARLPAGRYTVEATYEGKTVTRRVQVGNESTRVAHLRWPSNPNTDVVLGGDST